MKLIFVKKKKKSDLKRKHVNLRFRSVIFIILMPFSSEQAYCLLQ